MSFFQASPSPKQPEDLDASEVFDTTAAGVPVLTAAAKSVKIKDPGKAKINQME